MTDVVAASVDRSAASVRAAAGREFVPVSLGGDWSSTPELVRRLRPLFRRDPSVGCAIVSSALTPAVTVWIAGDTAQRDRVAALLCAGGSLAGGIADISATPHDLRADAVDGGWTVSGRSSPFVDAAGADLVLVSASGAGGHDMLLLWEPGAGGHADSPDPVERLETAGLRGCPVEVLTLRGVFVGTDSEILAHGADPGARAAVVTQSVLPALAVGIVDSALHLAYGYAEGRRLYDGAVLDLPHARSLVAEARTDLLIADALASTAVRVLHTNPEDAAPIAAASALLAPQLLNDAMRNLSVLFGSTFYGSVAPYGVFEELVRDLAAMSLLGLGSLDAAAVVSRALERTATTQQAADRYVFAARADLSELAFDLLGDGDRTAAAIVGSLDDPVILDAARSRAADLLPAITRLAVLRDELLESAGRTGGDRFRHDAAGAYAMLLAAGSCIGTWCTAEPDTAAFAPEWLQAALSRIESRLTGRRSALPEAVVEAAIADVAACVAASRSVTFERSPIFPSTQP